ncbi:MAG: phosphoserine aminotransferase, partial [Martelella sp.]
VFSGETINTPSMLAVEDAIWALEWAKGIGGLSAMKARADANAKVIFDFVEKNDWIENLAEVAETRSNTSVCLKIVDPAVLALDDAGQAAFAKAIVTALDKEDVAYDTGAYRDAPSGLRIWAGSTVETADMEALMGWLDWAFQAEKAKLAA